MRSGEFEVIDPGDPRARLAVQRYFDELDARFEDGFDPGEVTEDDLAELRPPRGAFLVMLVEDEPVAAGGVRTYGDAAEIKRMWVSPTARGQRLGSRLLQALEDEARSLGHSTVRLDTRGDVLTEAVAMYERAGYTRIERYNDNPYATHFFAKDLPPHAASSRAPRLEA